jgi:hypothetical protein
MVAALKRQLEALVALQPGSPEAREVEGEIERPLFALVEENDLPALDAIIRSIAAQGVVFEPLEQGVGYRSWKARIAGGPREIEIFVTRNRDLRSVSFDYKDTTPPTVTPEQRAVHALQEAFYDRYNAAARKAYGGGKPRLTPEERLLLRIGELEGDVNNGGFGQYLVNKDGGEAAEAVAALVQIGAHATARMLEQAMSAGTTDAQRSTLDARFYDAQEDLAMLAARHLGIAAG